MKTNNYLIKADEVKTLSHFADYLNERKDEEWDDECWSIMERNGWTDADNTNDICYSDTEVLTSNDNGEYEVVPRHGCYHVFVEVHNVEG
ncbi:MAG: hypothetical protein ACI3YC_06245, partial [Alloprevotella sp.]